MIGLGWKETTTGRRFFKPAHPIYKAISRIAALRQDEPALRYGRQYFREVSGS
jgi:hypothetical protein